jgi:hypothetical protein
VGIILFGIRTCPNPLSGTDARLVEVQSVQSGQKPKDVTEDEETQSEVVLEPLPFTKETKPKLAADLIQKWIVSSLGKKMTFHFRHL